MVYHTPHCTLCHPRLGVSHSPRDHLHLNNLWVPIIPQVINILRVVNLQGALGDRNAILVLCHRACSSHQSNFETFKKTLRLVLVHCTPLSQLPFHLYRHLLHVQQLATVQALNALILLKISQLRDMKSHLYVYQMTNSIASNQLQTTSQCTSRSKDGASSMGLDIHQVARGRSSSTSSESDMSILISPQSSKDIGVATVRERE